MTTEQMAEQYAEERYSDDKVSSNADKETLHTFRHIAKQAYLAGAKDRWVKVSEGLPENTQDVIVCTDKGNVYANRLIGLDWALYLRNDSKITHWMPLPTTPQD